MTIYALKNFYLLLFLSFFSFLHAENIDISKTQPLSLLEKSEVYIAQEESSIHDILEHDLFRPYSKHHINRGMLPGVIWIHFTLQNDTNATIEKSLVLTSPLLEYITLYTQDFSTMPYTAGVAQLKQTRCTLFPYYNIAQAPHSRTTYYLKIHSTLTPVDFTLQLKDASTYLREDRSQQFTNILLIGFVLALALYSLLLFFYVKDKSYLYYSLYLFALVYQQMTYLGLTQIYFPLEFIKMDMKIPVFKVNLLVITSALFAMHFLKIQTNKPFYTIYKVFISASFLEILILSSSSFYNLYIVIATGALFIIFNLSAGFIAYRKGHTQARLFIVGFSIVFFSYILIILDAVGLTSIMQDYQNILMFGTAFEALILSLAFADRYILLQKEKERVDARILEESNNRAQLVKNEVIQKTQALNSALETKELLLKEVHHRVKNNLQIILSIIRLQNDAISDQSVKDKFLNLENRINAISKTYNMLLIKEDLEEIDMQEYINALLLDIQETLQEDKQRIDIITDIHAMLPLKESVYIGLIVNELVTNAYKYAFDGGKGTISITLEEEQNRYTLTIEDNGKGYDVEKRPKTLGLKLIHTLIYDQLGGEMELYTHAHTKYIIRFTL